MISGMGDRQADLNEALARVSGAARDVGVLRNAGQSSDVMAFLDDALNLGSGRSLSGALGQVSEKDREGALQALARLLKAGVVGYEYRKVNGEVRKVFVDVALGSDVHRAPLARKNELDRYV